MTRCDKRPQSTAAVVRSGGVRDRTSHAQRHAYAGMRVGGVRAVTTGMPPAVQGHPSVMTRSTEAGTSEAIERTEVHAASYATHAVSYATHRPKSLGDTGMQPGSIKGEPYCIPS